MKSSPASSPQTNIPKSGNTSSTSRELPTVGRQRAGSNVSGHQPMTSPVPDSSAPFGLPAESIKKLDQIVQNFHTKAAALVLDSRMKVRPVRNANGTPKINKWYQIETEEIDDFREELKVWKTCGSLHNLPPPLIIEVYLDTSSLKENQSLVIVDDDGKRWDVMEQLQASRSSAGSNTPSLKRNTEVVLERWQVELTTTNATLTDDFGPILPTIYKKAIVFFRSLFITTRLLPAWKFASLSMKGGHPALIPQCRLLTAEPSNSSFDLLKTSIDGKPDPVTEYMFGDLDVPVGRLSTSVTYRNDCSFRIDDSESLLSSRFMGVDEDFFKPSMPQKVETRRPPAAEIGSLRDYRSQANVGDVQQTYGSLSTFHGDGALGTSPISALRAVKQPGSDTSSPPASLPVNIDTDAPHSLPISSRASIARPTESSSRRPSISFQPFKAGSLSASPVPRQAELDIPASQSSSRPASLYGAQPRNRSSLTAGMPASLRGGPPQMAVVDSPTVGSPRPSSASRYSSSFTHRRGRLSLGGGRPGDDEQSSSGRQSLASSVVQPGSGLLAEPSPGSSESLTTEDDNISDFLKALDSKKTLKSFEPTKRGEAATNKTVAQLSRFHMMKESNNALTESMTSSVQMNRSSSSSSRQLTSVPGMVAAASVSASSSPGKPISPHTPHTPAIPSRLSENSIADPPSEHRRTLSSRGGRPQMPAVREPSRQNTITPEGTTAIDIPLSPRLGSYQRRSSSAAQGPRAAMEEEEPDLAFANRSISLGADDREPPTLSTLLGRQMQLEEESTVRESMTTGLQPAAEIETTSTSSAGGLRGSTGETPPDGLLSVAQSSSPAPRRRYAGMVSSRGRTPPHSSRGSFTGSVSRHTRPDDDSVSEEPLVFYLSEMDAQGRRSLEESRSGTGGNASSSDKGSFEPRGIARRGW